MMTTLDPQPQIDESLHESSGSSDARLVEAGRRGDQAAYGELVLRYEQRLVRVVYRFVHNMETAEDLAQETFLKVYDRLEQFDSSRRFGPWLFRIGVNLTLDYLRRKKRVAAGRCSRIGGKKEFLILPWLIPARRWTCNKRSRKFCR